VTWLDAAHAAAKEGNQAGRSRAFRCTMVSSSAATAARVGAGGELLDLTEDDIRLWMFWLGLRHAGREIRPTTAAVSI